MTHVAAAFGYPLRKGCARSWAIGLPLVLLFPLGILPLLGYSIAAVRASTDDPDAGPPPWSSPARLLADGFWVALLLVLVSLPFAVVTTLTGRFLGAHLTGLPGTDDSTIASLVGGVLAAAVLGLPWGILLLVLMPAATFRFAASGRVRDLFDLPAAVRRVRADFAAWNLVAVAIVTAWAVGLAGLGIFGIGVIPGIYFAILASAHATAALHD